MPIEKLQSNIGYSFHDRAILLQSLTHTSFGHEFLLDKPPALRNNERLEFLGDAIIDLVVSDILLEALPNANEGQLSKMRASVVNEKTLADLAKRIELAPCLRLGKGESATGGSNKPSILSSCFEALVAAIYLDGGFLAVYPVLRHLFAPLFVHDQDPLNLYDHKTKLQEWVQSNHRVTPFYQLIETTGPDHAKCFVVEVKMHQKTLARADGPSKKEAEQNAAKLALKVLGILT